MEMKKIAMMIVAVITCSCNGQQNRYVINYDKTAYKDAASKDITERYQYTVSNQDKIKELYGSSDFILTKYPLNQLEIESLPIFNMDAVTKISSKKNIVEFINFKNDFQRQGINLYYNNTIVGDFRFGVKVGDPTDLLYYSLIGDDFNDPVRTGSLMGYLMKLMLEKRYFTFLIYGVNNVLFIVDDKKIYAVTEPTPEGKYTKTEINLFFHLYVGNNNLKNILGEGSFSVRKKINPSASSYFDKDYKVEVSDK